MTLSSEDLQLRSRLRRTLREQRRALTPAEQQAAAWRLADKLRPSLALHRARHIGLYLPADGELDPLPAILAPDRVRRRFYLPVLPRHQDAVLHFARWYPGEPLQTNRYGIGEPPLHGRRLVPMWRLDLVLMPLVAFDDQGRRLGMGGGFYDRALARLAHKPHRPRLLGVAHHFQRVERLPVADWDQPVDEVITD